MKKIIGVIALALAVLAIGLIISRNGNSSQGEVFSEATSDFVFTETEFDFGTIKQSGGVVTHDFPFTYTGTQPITVTGLPASCACTSGAIDKSELQTGDQGVLTVSFDPNLHAEPDGKFFKTVSVLTDPVVDEAPEVRIWVEIDLDLGPDAYKLKE